MGDEVVGVEKMKKEIRGGPGGEMPFAEFLEVSCRKSHVTCTHAHAVQGIHVFWISCRSIRPRVCMWSMIFLEF